MPENREPWSPHAECRFCEAREQANDALLRQMQESNTHMAPGSDPTVVETHAAETVLELELSGGFADAV